MSGIEGQFCIDAGTPEPKAFQEEPHAEARFYGVHKKQDLAFHQVQLQQCHHDQQLVLPAQTPKLGAVFSLAVMSQEHKISGSDLRT